MCTRNFEQLLQHNAAFMVRDIPMIYNQKWATWIMKICGQNWGLSLEAEFLVNLWIILKNSK